MSDRRPWCRRFALAAACACLVVFAHSPDVQAESNDSFDAYQPSEDDEPSHPRFYLRGSLGGGVLLASGMGPLYTESRVTHDWEVALGAVVQRNFAVHATLFGWSAFESPVNRHQERDQSLLGSLELAAVQTALGPGLTWYVEETGVYMSTAIGLATLERRSPPRVEDVEVGTGFEVMLGKEWRTDEAGFGLSVGYVSFVAVRRSSVDFGGGSLTVRLSLSLGG